MSDHSVQGYLRRRTTEQLQDMLLYYLDLPVCEYHAQVIQMILTILNERENDLHIAISPETIGLYEALYGASDE